MWEGIHNIGSQLSGLPLCGAVCNQHRDPQTTCPELQKPRLVTSTTCRQSSSCSLTANVNSACFCTLYKWGHTICLTAFSVCVCVSDFFFKQFIYFWLCWVFVAVRAFP
ncbi:unnamed protein product [Rangifer tarandus platyrhynchus]|uniref:Uncharacterized protein n=1 Tax=Rangifer tarandus platyrhynchus TaxID=3082113 RepID=A0AC59YAC2_RANTA